MSSIVHVTGLSEKTDEAELRKFLSFCGAIKSVDLKAGGSATVEFEKASAAKTASFLSGGSLQGSTITVKTEGEPTEDVEHTHTAGEDVHQESKPRGAIAAEYLAAGYELSDKTIQRALELDGQYGISKRFTDFFSPLWGKAKAVDSDKGYTANVQKSVADADAKYKVSEKTQAAAQVGRSYYEKALSSPIGAQVQALYLQGFKGVQAVHEEARRIADSRKQADPAPSASTVNPAATQGSTIHATPGVPLPSSAPAS